MPLVPNPTSLVLVQLKLVPDTGPLKLIAVPLAPLQCVRLATVFTVTVGLTVTVNVAGVPTQPLAVGVTVTVAVTGAVPALAAVYAPMSPAPLVPKPTLAVLVQLNVVPDTGPLKVIAVPLAPLQCVRLATVVTVAVGLTVTVNVVGVPTHPLAVGVTVTVAVTGAVPALAAV